MLIIAEQNKAKAFTLVELSIVIVIIGLIISGVVVGKNLVQASKYRKFIQELSFYKSVITQFKDEYGTVPGDFTKAASIWPTCIDDMSNGNTCNGNGLGTVTPSNEHYRFWQHLGLAELILGKYTGTYTAIDVTTVGVNTPVTAFKNYIFWPKANTSQYGKPAASKHNFHYRRYDGGGGAFTAAEANSIDLKIDDGRADAGWVGAEDVPCVTAAYNVARSYNLSQATAKCRMFLYW